MAQKHFHPIIGADVSFAKQVEDAGFVFTFDGKPEPYLETLKRHNYSWIRLRLFHSPDTLPNDLKYTIEIAKQAKQLGFKFLLDIHYSDTWADPGNQSPPKLWAGLSHDDLCDSVENYTFNVIQAFQKDSVMPDMVQVGNELSNGFLWPWGSLPHNWNEFVALQKIAISAIKRASSPNIPPMIMVHYDKSDDFVSIVDFINKLEHFNIDFDYLGLSYYPRWHGDLSTLKKSLRYINAHSTIDVLLAETAYPWKPFDSNCADSTLYTPKKQRDFIREIGRICNRSRKSLCVGFFYWEPAQFNSNSTLWDDDGNALPALYHSDKLR